jgi:hypothetical protein
MTISLSQSIMSGAGLVSCQLSYQVLPNQRHVLLLSWKCSARPGLDSDDSDQTHFWMGPMQDQMGWSLPGQS